MQGQQFDEWNEIKKEVNQEPRDKQVNIGKIYWCNVGVNVGREVYGKGSRFARPVLVINVLPNGTFWVCLSLLKSKTKQVLCFTNLRIQNKRLKWHC